MLPHYHAFVAVAATSVVVILFVSEIELATFLLWLIISALVAALIDVDVMVHVRRASRTDPELGRFNDISEVSRDFKGFMDTITRKGILRKVVITHFAVSITLAVLVALLLPSLAPPVLIGVVTHLATDTPYLRPAIWGPPVDGEEQ